MDGLAGVTAMAFNVAAVTVSTVEPVWPDSAAEMVVAPTVAPVASPLEPVAVEMVATAGVAELQVTWAVMSCVVWSEYVPVAVNCFVVPAAMDGLAGVTAMDVS